MASANRRRALFNPKSPFVSFATFCSNSLRSLLSEFAVRNPISKFAITLGQLKRWHPPTDVAHCSIQSPPLFPLRPSVQILFARFCRSLLSGTRFRSSPSPWDNLRDGIRQPTSRTVQSKVPLCFLCDLLFKFSSLAFVGVC